MYNIFENTMKRAIYDKLLKWKASSNRKPLIIEGARQVGKTWIINEFGKNEYKKYAYINCDNNPLLKSLFDDYDMDRIIRQLSAITNINITANDTLIFFDEVQELENGLTFLKYFYENKPDYHVVVAGSLLGLMIHKGTGFPVGKTETLKLEPLSFNEFLLALGKEQLVSSLKERKWDELCSLKTIFIDLFKQYLYVGGMPEVVLDYINNNNLQSIRKIQDSILKDYEKDFSKHVDSNEAIRITMVWNSIPKHLGKENKKFVYGTIKKGARSKEYEKSIMWLENAGLIHKIKRINKFAKPLKYYEDKNSFKIYLLDVGLLGAMSGVLAKDILASDSVFTEYKGFLAEQYFAQQYFSLNNNDLFYYSNDNSTRENDFVLEEDKIYIVEVKSGFNSKSKSLSTSLKENKDTYGLRFSMNDYIKQERITNIPIYLCYDWLYSYFNNSEI